MPGETKWQIGLLADTPSLEEIRKTIAYYDNLIATHFNLGLPWRVLYEPHKPLRFRERVEFGLLDLGGEG